MRKGSKHSREAIQKNREAHLGKRLSEEHKTKIRISAKGRHHTEETKYRLSQLKVGDRNPAKRADVRKKMSEAARGKSVSERGHERDCRCCICKRIRGELKQWNKGLTKENHPGIAKGAKKSSESHKGRVPWNKGKKLGVQSKESKRKK